MPLPIKVQADALYAASLVDDIDPHVAASPTGKFGIAWWQDSAVADEDKLTFPQPPLYYDTVFSRDDKHPSMAYLPDGRIVAAFARDAAAGDEQIMTATLLTTGFGSTGDIGVNAAEAGLQNRPEVVVLANGRYAYVWMDLATLKIRGAIYNALGQVVAAPFDVAIDKEAAVNDPHDLGLAALPDGGFAVTYDNQTSGASLVIVSPAGAPGAVIDFDASVNANFESDVALLADGRLVMVAYALTGYRGRFFNPDGTPDGASFAITGFNNDLTVSVAALNDGRFVIVYDRLGTIYGQVMKADGTADGAEFQVNTEAGGTQTRPHLATLADGRFVVAWEDDRTNGGDVYHNIWDPREAGLFAAASGLDDEWVGTSFNDTIFGAAGKDNLSGRNGSDYLYGDAGEDTLNGEAGDDRLRGGAANDTLNGGADADLGLEGGIGNDIVNGGLGNDRIFGGDGNDTINGDDDNDNVNGGNGNDTINGGAGAEVFLGGDAGSDTINGGIGNDRIDGGNDGDTLNGEADRDNITGGAGVDTINGGDEVGAGDVALFGNAGDDTVNGGQGDDRMDGGTENDTLNGGDGADYITAGAGNDTITGGLGADTLLYGEAGQDTFVFNDPTEGNDLIRDWVAVDDTLRIDASAFGGGLVAGALAANQLVVGAAPAPDQAFGQFLYTTGTGQLAWDADGTGAGAAVLITRLFNGVAVNTLAVGDFDIVA